LLHLVGSSVLLYLIDDARSNKNQIHLYLQNADISGAQQSKHEKKPNNL